MSGGRARSALVIEVSSGQAAFVCDLVRKLGFSPVWSSIDSAEAFADLNDHTPDALIVGVDVEPLDGIALAKTIRSAAEPAVKDLPIIFLTPNATERQVDEVRAIRRSALLVKPASLESLRTHLSLLMRNGRPPASDD